MSDLNLTATANEVVQRYFRLKQADKLLPEIKIHQQSLFPKENTPERTELNSLIGKGRDYTYADHIYGGGAWLSRWVLDHPEEVRGKRVLDVASGSGALAIAAAMAGAAEVTAIDIDYRAMTFIEHNARANNVLVKAIEGNAAFETSVFEDKDVITATDFYYDDSYARDHLQRLLLKQAKFGKTLLAASWFEVPPLLAQEGELLHLPVTYERPPNFFRKIAFPQAAQ